MALMAGQMLLREWWTQSNVWNSAYVTAVFDLTLFTQILPSAHAQTLETDI